MNNDGKQDTKFSFILPKTKYYSRLNIIEIDHGVITNQLGQ